MLRWSRFHHSSPWMGGSAPCASSTSEDVGCKSCFFSPNYEQACVEPEQCTYGIMGKILKDLSLDDINISSITEDDENLTAQELGATLNEVLHISGSNECLDHNSNLSLNQDEICNDIEMQSISVSMNMLNGLGKREMTLLSESEMLQSHPLEIDAREELSSRSVHIESSSKPTTPKLVSAMKGSRTQLRMLPKTKLSVKWAPDVYDPAPRSESHTVKGYRRHSKSIKKDYYKHGKSKPSRGSGADRRHAHRRSASNSIDPRMLRLQALHERFVRNDSGQSHVVVPDHAVRAQEMKCGGNFYMESLSPVRPSVAKAS